MALSNSPEKEAQRAYLLPQAENHGFRVLGFGFRDRVWMESWLKN